MSTCMPLHSPGNNLSRAVIARAVVALVIGVGKCDTLPDPYQYLVGDRDILVGGRDGDTQFRDERNAAQ